MQITDTIRRLIPPQLLEIATSQRSTKVIGSNPSLRSLVSRRFLFDKLSNREHIDLVLSWLNFAIGKSADGGIPHMVDLRQFVSQGRVTFAPSYPETTGYMLCTLIFGLRHKMLTLSRAKIDRITNYLLSVQRPDGAMPGSGNETRELAFDTGQVLTGLVAYYRHVEQRPEVGSSIARAADWLAAQVGADGAYSAASCYNGARAYYVRATIGLLQAAIAFGRSDWLDAAARNGEWTFRQRFGRSWFERFSFEDGAFQNLHGIAYTLRGLIDLGRHLCRPEYVEYSKCCIDQIFSRAYPALPVPNSIPGHFARSFTKHRRTISPTGMCQIALCCFLLDRLYQSPIYSRHASELIATVKRFQFRGFAEPALNGLLPGSWPITGPYMHCALPNWPIKFFLDGLYIQEGADPLALEG